MNIKIGRKEYEIKKGDYILYNGYCYQLFSGDGRTLKSEKFSSYNNLRIPETVLKNIDFDSLKKVIRGNLTYFIWK